MILPDNFCFVAFFFKFLFLSVYLRIMDNFLRVFFENFMGFPEKQLTLIFNYSLYLLIHNYRF